MVPAAHILQSFLKDAIRLHAGADECLRSLVEQARAHHQVSPAQVRQFYQQIHTLKGTAGMVPGAQGVAEVLHLIEGKLTCQTLVESARKTDWLPLAVDSLRQVKRALDQAQLNAWKTQTQAAHPAEALVRGLLVSVGIGEKERRLCWFPLSCLSRVFMPEELTEGAVLCLEGSWVPVFGVHNPHVGHTYFGLGVQSSSGSAVIVIDQVEGICAWSRAQAVGAEPGLSIFDRMAQSSRAA